MVVRSRPRRSASLETGTWPATARATSTLNWEMRRPVGRMAASKTLLTAREARLRCEAVQVSATVAQSARSRVRGFLVTPGV